MPPALGKKGLFLMEETEEAEEEKSPIQEQEPELH